MVPAKLRHLDDETLALLALGASSPGESAAAEEHLAGCEACRERLGERLGELAALAESVEPEPPPAWVRDELLERLAEESTPAGAVPPPAPSAAPRRRRLLLPLAASFLLGALAGALGVRQAFVDDVDRLAARADVLAAERAAAERRVERLAGELAAARSALALTPAREAILLAGLPAAPESHGRVFVDRAGGRALFVARGLPVLPDGRTYQLWRIVGGQPRPAGLFGGGEATLVVEGVDATAGEVWAVTEEPAGGVPSPTGPMVLSS